MIEKSMRVRFLALTVVWLVMACALPGVGLTAEQPSAAHIRINEFLADNGKVIHDEYGEYDDVLELYNPGPEAAHLGGMYLTDHLDEPTRFRIADGISLPAGGFLLFWADNSPDQGVYHTNFALSKSGESIGLFDTDGNGNVPVDTYRFGPQSTNVSEGRCPDGGQTWHFYTSPTMGATNEPCGTSPAILATEQVPAFPQAGKGVTVTATITDDGVVVAATLWYSAGAEYLAVAMDGLGNDQYSAVLPGQAEGTWVQYYLEAKDDAGRQTTEPPGAPQRAYSYVAGYAPPSVALNELVSNNQTTLEDPDEPGEHPDWLELYNGGTEVLNLGGLYLSDNPTDPVQFRIQDGVMLPAGGFLVFYADGEPEQGPLHTDFKLSADGEVLALYGAGGKVRIAAVQFPALGADVSYGRQPDGTGDWGVRECATPGRSNRTCGRLFLPLVTRAVEADPPPLPLRLDCGSDAPYTTVSGTVFLADRAWSANAAFGYVGGHKWVPTEWWQGIGPVGGTDDHGLYRTQRYGWQEYRVSRIPNGDYLLTLRFDEQEVHGPGFKIFDVAVEGQTVLGNLDLYDQVGRYHALDRRFAVTVADGELNVIATPVAGEACLSALELVPRQRDSIAPAVPVSLAATPSYRAVLLDWADNAEDDLAGYHVYRAKQPDGPYTRLTAAGLVHLSRYQDNIDTTHVRYYYRITAVDTFGNESGQSVYASGEAIDIVDATLPVYQLKVSPRNLAILNANPWSDEEVPGVFTYAGQVILAEVRFRGSGSRSLPKKSWKIKFPADSPFPNQDRINVIAMWSDESLFRSKLATGVFEAAGVRPPQAEHVLLALNGQYMGVYTRNEQVDEAFLRRTGRNPGASIYKVGGRFAELLPNEAEYRSYYEKETNKGLDYTDLIAFIELINDTPDSKFAAALSQVMDVESFLDYYAIIVLTADFDSASHNIYLVHDLDTDLWELLPWDLEAPFRNIQAPIDMGTLEHPDGHGSANILRSRVLAVPRFRAYYCWRLADYMDTLFADVVMVPQVDAAYGAIEQDGLRDWRKIEWEKNSSFVASPGWIKTFISQRKEFLRGEMTTFCPAE